MKTWSSPRLQVLVVRKILKLPCIFINFYLTRIVIIFDAPEYILTLKNKEYSLTTTALVKGVIKH